MYVTDDNYPKAFYYCELAAKQGDASAQFGLAYLYLYGKGVPEDKEQAIYYFELAAEQGVEDAKDFLEEIK